MSNAELIKASPLAARFAAEMGVELSAVSGTGHAGKILKHDVQLWLDGKLKRRDASRRSPVSISAPVNTLAARLYLKRVNDRFPGTELTLADLAGRAVAASASAQLQNELDEYLVSVDAQSLHRRIPADGKNRKLREIAEKCAVSYEPRELRDSSLMRELAAFPGIDLKISGCAENRCAALALTGKGDDNGIMYMTLTLSLRQGDEGEAARLLEKTGRLIEDPVMLML